MPELFGGTFDESRDTDERLLAASNDNSLFVAVDEAGLVVGSVMILSNAHSFWLLRFVIDDHHPEYELAASGLILAAEERAKALGHNSIIVYSSPRYNSLDNRYLDLGFTKADDYTCFWKEVL